jgi:hypothetical protein
MLPLQSAPTSNAVLGGGDALLGVAPHTLLRWLPGAGAAASHANATSHCEGLFTRRFRRFCSLQAMTNG